MRNAEGVCIHFGLSVYIIYQGFSKSAFKGPNLNFHQCQRSGPEQLVITKLVFNKHSVAYITCITNKHYFFFNKVPFAFKIH